VGVEKAGLAKAPRGRESDRHAISGRALERIELEPSINERVRLNGPLVAERVHRTSLYGFAGQSWVRARGFRSARSLRLTQSARTGPRGVSMLWSPPYRRIGWSASWT
jgi:hypothetical protein